MNDVTPDLEAAVNEVFKSLVVGDDHTTTHAAGALMEMMKSINAVGIYEYVVPMIPDVGTYPDFLAYMDDLRAWVKATTILMASHLTNHGLERLSIPVLHDCAGEYHLWSLAVSGTDTDGGATWELTTNRPA